ncbi:MAG TPA: hypothetical protein PLK57_05465 [Clostridiales bacterium]|nr:hypothetical protein [Clostridiales bacterium]HXK84143.1 hypothetical protein [Clostridiales bacterium]
MKYLYEMHLHTSEVSGCGRVSGADSAVIMIPEIKTDKTTRIS